MDISSSLHQLGLTDSEISTYLALLELDTAPVSQIARLAHIKRPTCYLVLDSLVEKGLVTKVPATTRAFYKAEPANKLLALIEDKMELTKALVPLLLSLSSTDTLAPKVKLYEGKQGQAALFTEILTHLKTHKNPEIAWVSNWEAIESKRPGELDRSFKVHSKHKVQKREIIQDSLKSRELIKKYAYPEFEYRMIPSSQSIGIDLGITGNKVAIFNLASPLFGVLIEHKTIATSFRSFFELAWIGANK